MSDLTSNDKLIIGTVWYVVILPAVMWGLWEYALEPLVRKDGLDSYFTWVAFVFMVRLMVPKTPGEQVTIVIAKEVLVGDKEEG